MSIRRRRIRNFSTIQHIGGPVNTTFLGGLGNDVTELETTSAGAGTFNLGTFTQNFTTPPDTRVVMFGAFDHTDTANVAFVSSASIGGVGHDLISGSGSNVLVPGVFVFVWDPVTALSGDVVLNFSRSDIIAVYTYTFSMNTTFGGDIVNGFTDGSPLWRAVFNTTGVDKLCTSICNVPSTDPTITDLFLLQTTFSPSEELIPIKEIAGTRIKCRVGAHNNSTANFEHQWEGGISGDDAKIALHEVQIS